MGIRFQPREKGEEKIYELKLVLKIRYCEAPNLLVMAWLIQYSFTTRSQNVHVYHDQNHAWNRNNSMK